MQIQSLIQAHLADILQHRYLRNPIQNPIHAHDNRLPIQIYPPSSACE